MVGGAPLLLKASIESVERGFGKRWSCWRDRRGCSIAAFRCLCARGGSRQIADAAHDAAQAVGGRRSCRSRLTSAKNGVRVLRHARLHRHPDDVRVVEVAFDAGTGAVAAGRKAGCPVTTSRSGIGRGGVSTVSDPELNCRSAVATAARALESSLSQAQSFASATSSSNQTGKPPFTEACTRRATRR